MKLLAKDPEDRYQTGSGLAYDIGALANMIETNVDAGAGDFSLASRDVPDRLRMPERLYGRDVELAELIKSVEGIALGRAQLILISGPSGVGKSSLVREVMRPVAGRRGHLISGKFDQLNRGSPIWPSGRRSRNWCESCSVSLPSAWKCGVGRCRRPWVRARRSYSMSFRASNF